MSLNTILNTALTGLKATQFSINVTSNNISNVNTAGYTAKTANTVALSTEGLEEGVGNDLIARSVNTGLQQQAIAATTDQSALTTTQSYLDQLQTAFGTPAGATDASGNAANGTSPAGLFNDLSDAFTALQATPDSTTLQDNVVNAAQTLATSLNSVSNTVQTLRNDTEPDIAATVNIINQTTAQIAAVNAQIVAAQANNQSTADLQDTRDQLVTTLAQNVQINTYTTSNGALYIGIAGGGALVDASAHSLNFTPSLVSVGSASGVNLSGITLDGADITSTLGGGTLNALITLRDQTLPQAQGQLDEFTSVMMTSLNTAGVQLFSDPNNASFSYPADSVGIAGRVTVNSAVVNNPWQLRDGTAAATPSTATGSATLITAVIGAVFTGQQSFRTTGLGLSGATNTITSSLPASDRLADYANQMVTYQGTQSATVNSQLSTQTALSTSLTKQLTSEDGVSLDKELSNLVSLQNAYGANAKVVTTVEQMYTDLMGMIS